VSDAFAPPGAWRRAVVLLTVALAFGCGRQPAEPVDHVLLITVDTLRADRIDAFGGSFGLTPHLDALAQQSVRFETAYAAAPFTLPSVAALMTGTAPEALGVYRNESTVPDAVPTLASRLRSAGWQTHAVVSNFVLRSSSGIDLGFERFDDSFPQREVVRLWPERIAVDTTDAALEQLDACALRSDAPCFLWVHYQDPHGPYTPPDGFLEPELQKQARLPDAARELPVSPNHLGHGAIPTYQVIDGHRDIGFYRASYHAEIRYLDTEIGRLLRALDERGLTERSLVVFAADHGEGLGEEDYWFAHGEYLNDALVRVPLLFRVPGRPPRARSDVAALTDVLPTMLAALDLEPTTPGPDGRDLLAPGAEKESSRPYFAALDSARHRRYGLVEGEFKLVVTEQDGIGRAQLSRRGRDAVDMTAAAPQVVASMRRHLNRIRDQLRRNARPEVLQDLSTQDRENLRALGYVEGPNDP